MADAQFAVYPVPSAVGQKINGTGTGPLDPATDLADAVWLTTLANVPHNSAVVVRIATGETVTNYSLTAITGRHVIHSSFRRASDANWGYYHGGNFGGAQNLVLQKKNAVHNTDFHGQLAGRALEQVADAIDDGVAPVLARTQRLRPVSQWTRHAGAQTVFVEWKPSVAVANGAALTVVMSGVPVTGVTSPSGIPEGDTEGVLLALPVNATNAANIDRASNTIAGHVEIQITHDGVTDTTWMGTRVSTRWRPVTGNSPYVIPTSEHEILVAVTKTDGANVYYLKETLERVLLTEEARRFAIAEAQPNQSDFNGVAYLNANFNAAGNQLTLALGFNGVTQGNRYAIAGVWAR